VQREDRLATVQSVVEDILSVTVGERDPAEALAQIRAQCMIRLEQIAAGDVREITHKQVKERAQWHRIGTH
jgi:hypothetical protein